MILVLTSLSLKREYRLWSFRLKPFLISWVIHCLSILDTTRHRIEVRCLLDLDLLLWRRLEMPTLLILYVAVEWLLIEVLWRKRRWLLLSRCIILLCVSWWLWPLQDRFRHRRIRLRQYSIMLLHWWRLHHRLTLLWRVWLWPNCSLLMQLLWVVLRIIMLTLPLLQLLGLMNRLWWLVGKLSLTGKLRLMDTLRGGCMLRIESVFTLLNWRWFACLLEPELIMQWCFMTDLTRVLRFLACVNRAVVSILMIVLLTSCVLT